MTELKDVRIQLVITLTEKKAIDKWRSKQEDLPSRSEAIRRFIKHGLTIKTPVK